MIAMVVGQMACGVARASGAFRATSCCRNSSSHVSSLAGAFAQRRNAPKSNWRKSYAFDMVREEVSQIYRGSSVVAQKYLAFV
jgi:hypothetical protein